MRATERVIDDLNVAKLVLCNPRVLTPEMCVKIGQAINGAIDLLKEQEPAEPEVEALNEIDRLCRCPKCHRYLFYEKQKYCDKCGQEVKWE